MVLRVPVARAEVVEFVDQTLGVNPAQRMASDIELAGIVANDDGLIGRADRGYGSNSL